MERAETARCLATRGFQLTMREDDADMEILQVTGAFGQRRGFAQAMTDGATVTAFLYSGLGGRPFWNSALLAPRFLASAFVTGPAFVILLLQVLRRVAGLKMGDVDREGHGPHRARLHSQHAA
jgi:hypothetical protein